MCRIARALLVIVTALRGVGQAVPVDGPLEEGRDKKPKAAPAKPGDVGALVGQLGAEDWRVRDRAMQELMAIGDAARPALRAALGSQDAEVRWRASYALGLIENTIEVAAKDPARALYASAAQARARKDGEEEARQLYGEVAERFPKTRWAAAARERLAALAPQKAPGQKAPEERVLAALVARLGSASWPERQEASRQLAALGEPARASLERAGNGPDPEAAWRARRLLQRLEPAQAGPQPRAAGGQDPRVVVELFGEGMRMKHTPGRGSDPDSLVRALASDDPTDVARAREALLNLGQAALEHLVRGLDTADEAAGVEIMGLLADITKEQLGFDPGRWQAWWRALQKRGSD